jgi:hypothetical protein
MLDRYHLTTLRKHSTPSETEKIKELRDHQGIIKEVDVESQSIVIRLFIDSKLKHRQGVFPIVTGLSRGLGLHPVTL